MIVDEPRGDPRSGQGEIGRGGSPSTRSSSAAPEREQAPWDDRRHSDAQRAPGGAGGARPSLPERRELSRQAPMRSPGRDSRGGPSQGGAFGRPPVRHQPPQTVSAQGRSDLRGSAGPQSPRHVDRAAAAEEFFPGGQERVPRGLGRRQSSADGPGRRTGGNELGAGGARRGGPSAAQRYAAGGRRGDAPPRGRRYVIITHISPSRLLGSSFPSIRRQTYATDVTNFTLNTCTSRFASPSLTHFAHAGRKKQMIGMSVGVA